MHSARRTDGRTDGRTTGRGRRGKCCNLPPRQVGGGGGGTTAKAEATNEAAPKANRRKKNLRRGGSRSSSKFRERKIRRGTRHLSSSTHLRSDPASRTTSRGPSIYDVRKILGFFDPLPPCPHLGLIYSTKFTQRPLLHLLLG